VAWVCLYCCREGGGVTDWQGRRRRRKRRGTRWTCMYFSALHAHNTTLHPEYNIQHEIMPCSGTCCVGCSHAPRQTPLQHQPLVSHGSAPASTSLLRWCVGRCVRQSLRARVGGGVERLAGRDVPAHTHCSHRFMVEVVQTAQKKTRVVCAISQCVDACVSISLNTRSRFVWLRAAPRGQPAAWRWRHQEELASSNEKRVPPIGAPNAAETPAAQPIEMNICLSCAVSAQRHSQHASKPAHANTQEG
jgi:hypothetical protein